LSEGFEIGGGADGRGLEIVLARIGLRRPGSAISRNLKPDGMRLALDIYEGQCLAL
jgi:hypothetical protein